MNATSTRMAVANAERPIAWDLVVASLILVLAVVVGGTALWLGRSNAPHTPRRTVIASSSRQVVIIDTIGKNGYVAGGALNKAHLNVRVSLARSRTVPRGNVISQHPLPGSRASEGSIVRLTVSDGP